MRDEEIALRIVFAGTPAAAVPSLRALAASGHEIVAVVTRPDARAGRGRREQPSDVAAVATELGIPVVKAATARDPWFADTLPGLGIDLGVVVAYGALIPQPVLDIPARGWVNLHFSLLPAWRGAAPVQAAIRAGDEITGASVFQLEAGLDTGPVFGVITHEIGPRDTAGALLDALAHSGSRLLATVVDGIAAGTLLARPQSDDGVSAVGKITVDEARIDWSAPALAIDRLVRAMTPEPGPWTDSPWGRLQLGPLEPTEETGLAPGELRAAKREVLVGTGSWAIRLGTVQAPGRRPMAAADWARGVRPEPGTKLGEQLGGGE